MIEHSVAQNPHDRPRIERTDFDAQATRYHELNVIDEHFCNRRWSVDPREYQSNVIDL